MTNSKVKKSLKKVDLFVSDEVVLVKVGHTIGSTRVPMKRSRVRAIRKHSAQMAVYGD